MARLLPAIMAGACVLTAPMYAQVARPMSIVDLASLPRLLDPQLSPDARIVAYMLTRPDWQANRAVGQIWLQPVGGGPATQLTDREGGATSARWSPDGRHLLFLARGSDGITQVFVQPASGGAAREVTRHPTAVSQPSWAPDGSGIYFLASDERTAEERERERLRDDVFAFEENYKQRHLWRAPLAGTSAESASKVTSGDFSVLSFRVSRDGSRIVTHRSATPLAGDSPTSEVWVASADGSGARALTHNGVEESEGELSPDNRQVLFVAEANEAFQPYYSGTLFLVPAAGGTPRMVLREFPHSVERAAWSPDGASILAVVNMGVHSEIFRIDVATGRRHQLTDGRHSVQFWSVAPRAGRMIFQLDQPDRPGDAWTLGTGSAAGGTPSRVTSVYDSLARQFQLPRQEKVVWAGADGTAVEGILFYPLLYEPGRRYPLVVQLHGGPLESDKFGFGPGVIVSYVPVLAARGYAVLRPNYRGSTGYGDAFLRDVVGHYFNNMQGDVLAGVDHLVARGVADPDRLAVMGWSAGGHLTNRLITITRRFKAASSSAGAANWVSLYAQTDTRANRALWFGGTPWQPDSPIAAMWAQSPISGAAAVTTPTLFVVGQEDPRVPMAQSVEMFRALRAHGVPTRLLVAPREGHQWGELRHQIAKANAELEWFERHVRGRSYVWERAPDGAAAR
jgi:dipeptidyl aminopeptidase/acylaminoacyl peptidase